MQDPDVCRGAIGTQAPIIADSLRSLSVTSPGATRLCTTIFGLCPFAGAIPHKVELSPEPQALSREKLTRATELWETGLTRKGEDAVRDGATFQVVQISDVHIDKKYLVRSSNAPLRTFAAAGRADVPNPRIALRPGRRLRHVQQANLLSRLRTFINRTARQIAGRRGTRSVASPATYH
jgi:hypothetical protein